MRQASRAILMFGACVALGGIPLSLNAQSSSMKDQLVGTWALVSVYNVLDDGKKIYPNGQNAKGRAVFDSNGRFSVIMVNSELPKYASKNRQQGTPEEFRAVAQGTLTYFGTYSIDEASKALKFNFEASSFPNMNGTTSDRK
jgi:hypothetical protein